MGDLQGQSGSGPDASNGHREAHGGITDQQLPSQPFGAQAVGDTQVLRMVSDDQVFPAQALRRQGHLAQAVAAIAGTGMAVQVAWFDQLRQRIPLGSGDLAAILAQLQGKPRSRSP